MIRRATCRVIGLAVLALVAVPAAAGGQVIKVTLLGTGAPPPTMERFGPSILVEAGEDKLLFDAGRGMLQRLFQIKAPLKDLRMLFLTHLHSDHVVGLPDFWLTGWLFAERAEPLRVWGPTGTKAMMEHLDRAFEFDIRIRLYDDQSPPQGIVVHVQEVAEGVVYERNGVRVTAFEVDHAPIKPAFGYRIDYAGHSVVLSGDTRVSENLIQRAQGTDVLIHEVASLAFFLRAGFEPGRAKRIVDHHVTAEQAGEIFARVKPRLAVYSHIVAAPADLIPPTRRTYSGRLEVGEDLMVIEVGENIVVRRQPHREP